MLVVAFDARFGEIVLKDSDILKQFLLVLRTICFYPALHPGKNLFGLDSIMGNM